MKKHFKQFFYKRSTARDTTLNKINKQILPSHSSVRSATIVSILTLKSKRSVNGATDLKTVGEIYSLPFIKLYKKISEF